MTPTKPTLGRLENVDLRTYWLREETEFTPWLGSDENITLLGDAWPEQHEWLKSKLELLYRIFRPIVMKLDVNSLHVDAESVG